MGWFNEDRRVTAGVAVDGGKGASAREMGGTTIDIIGSGVMVIKSCYCSDVALQHRKKRRGVIHHGVHIGISL